MENYNLNDDFKKVLNDLSKTKNITFTSMNTNVHHSTIYNWISKGKKDKNESYYLFYKEYAKITGIELKSYKHDKPKSKVKNNMNVSKINNELKEISLDDFDSNQLYEFDCRLSKSQNIIRKFILKKKGKDLEDNRQFSQAVDYYNSILNNSYFENDYYIYRRLSMLYEREHQWKNHLDIIKKFFKSGIFASEYQIRWMVHKLFKLEKYEYIGEEEVDELIIYYDQNGSKKKDLENYPVILAERIFQRKDGAVGIKSQLKYEKQQRKYELIEIGAELERNDEYDDALAFYWELVENNENGATEFYKRLAAIYEKLNQYENELYVLSLFYKKKFNIVGSYTKNEFQKRLDNINSYMGTQFTVADLISGDLAINKKSNDELFKFEELYEKGMLTKEVDLKKKELFFPKNQVNVSIFNNQKNVNSFESNDLKFDGDNKIITIGSNNFRKLLKSDIGDEVIAQIVNRKNNVINLEIVEMTNSKSLNYTSNTKVIIKISEDNFKAIQDLSSDELITIKCKCRRGKVVLRQKDNVGNINENKPENVKIINGSSNVYSKPKGKYILKLEMPTKYKLNIDNPFEYSEYLTEDDNIKMKFLLKDKGNYFTREKLFKDAIDYYEYLKNNTYFENDWYPYRHLTMIYEKQGMHKENIENIKQLFYSGIYCNGYQYIWFVHKLNNSLNYVSVSEDEISVWLNYYWNNGAKNKDKLDIPVFIADRIIKKDNYIRVYSKNIFYDNYQKLSEYQEKVRFSEQIEDYESELEAIKLYYQEYYAKISHKQGNWFRNKLAHVNKKLGTDYNYLEFI